MMFLPFFRFGSPGSRSRVSENVSSFAVANGDRKGFAGEF